MWVKIRFGDLQALHQRIAELEAKIVAMPPQITPGTITASKISSNTIGSGIIASARLAQPDDDGPAQIAASGHPPKLPPDLSAAVVESEVA